MPSVPLALSLPLDPADRVRADAEALAARAPLPARVRNVLAGTAGWTDPSLLSSGRFYPPGARTAEARLRHYARHFSLVEVDASYYVLPSAGMTTRWVERTPAEFVFDVKAFSLLTGHAVDVTRLPTDLREALPASLRGARVAAERVPAEVTDACWDRFVHALAPLGSSGRLGAILLQFPPWFDATRGNARVVERARARVESLSVSVEFRHRSWGEPARFGRVIDWLRDLRAAYVCVDEPQGLDNSMPPHVAVAHPALAVLRLHGRRADVWDKPVSVQEKYDYLYHPDELRPWARAVAALSTQADSVHVVFNNCRSNHAVLGAKDLTAALVDVLEADRPPE